MPPSMIDALRRSRLVATVAVLAAAAPADARQRQPASGRHSLTVRVSHGAVPLDAVRVAFFRSRPLAIGRIALNDKGIGRLTGVSEGRYFIAARAWVKDRAWAAFKIANVKQRSIDLSLRLRPAGRISGRVVSNSGELPLLYGVSVAAAWMHDEIEINPLVPDQARISADGSFQIEGLFGRRAIQLIGLDPEWRVQTIRKGRSIVTTGVEVPLNSRVDVTIVVTRW